MCACDRWATLHCRTGIVRGLVVVVAAAVAAVAAAAAAEAAADGVTGVT